MLEILLLSVVIISQFGLHFPALLNKLRQGENYKIDFVKWGFWLAAALSLVLYAVIGLKSVMPIIVAGVELAFCLIDIMILLMFRRKEAKPKKQKKENEEDAE